MAGYLKPFDSVNFTPPHGRLGHSVPTPRPLGGPPQEMDENKQDSQMAWAAAEVHSTTSLFPPTVKPSPAQFYCRRDHALGGGFSRLDRIRTHQDLPYIMENFPVVQETISEEEEEEGDDTDSGRPQSLKSITSSNHRRVNVTLDRFTGDSLLHFSYSSAAGSMGLGPPDSQLGGSFVAAFSQGLSLNTSLNAPFLHQNLSPSGESSHLFPTAARNPNKAIVTIDAQSSLILIANEMTCELFGYQKDELVGMKVQRLFTEPYQANQRALVEHNIDASGETVLVSGKVMDAITSYGIEFPVSVWMKRVSPAVQPRVIVVIEPVERTSAHFIIDEKGTLVSSDPWFACIFGFTASSEMVGRSVLEFIPSLLTPTNTAELSTLPPKQALTGRTRDGGVFPLTVKFTDVSQNLSVGDLYSPSEGTTNSQELSSSVVIKCSDSSSSAHSQPVHNRPNGGESSDSVIISKRETAVDLDPTGERSDSNSYCSVIVKSSESESSRSPMNVEGEVPNGGRSDSNSYCSVIVKSSESESSRSPTSVKGEVPIGGRSDSDTGSVIVKSSESESSRSPTSVEGKVSIGGRSDSDSYCSVIVKCSESESSRSPTSVKGEVPIGGRSDSDTGSVIVKSSESESSRSPTSVEGKVSIGGRSDSDTGSVFLKCSESESSRSPTSVEGEIPIGGRSDSDTGSVIVKSSESESFRSPTSVEGEVPIGGRSDSDSYCSVIVKSSESESSRSPMSVGGEVPIGGKSDSDTGSIIVKSSESESSRSPTSVKGKVSIGGRSDSDTGSIIVKSSESESSRSPTSVEGEVPIGGRSDSDSYCSVIVKSSESESSRSPTSVGGEVPIGGRSDSDTGSIIVKCSESESSRSPTSVEGEVPIGGRSGSDSYCSVIVKSSESESSRSPTSVGGEVPIGGKSDSDTGSVIVKSSESESSRSPTNVKREVPIGGKSDSDSYCSVIVKSSESESSRSPTNVKREVPIGGKSDSDSYCSVIVKSSESESSRSPTNVKGEVPIGGPGHHYCVNAKVIVHAVLSGMISFLPNGTIHGCNHHFALMLFGYSQQELLKKDITFLIPEFYNHICYVDDRGMPLPPLDEEDGDEDDMFPLVTERSLSPDKAFEAFWSTTGQAEARMTLSPSHRKDTNVLNSTLRQAELGGQPAGLTDMHACALYSCDSGMVSDIFMRPRSAPEFLPEEPRSEVACSNAVDAASNKRPDQQQTTGETATLKSELLVTLFHEESLEDGGGGDGDSNEGLTPSSSQVMSEGLTPSSSQVMSEGLTPSSSQVMSEGLTLLSPQVTSEVDGSKSLSGDRDHAGVMQHEGVAEGSALEELATTSAGIDINTRQVDSVMTASTGNEMATGNCGAEGLARVVRPVSSMSEPDGEREDKCTTLVNSPSVDQLIELLSGQQKKQGDSVPTSQKDPFSSTPETRLTEPLQYSQHDGPAVAGGMRSGGVCGMDECSVTSISSLPEGTFLGEARHKDGSLLAIVFQLKCFTLADGMPLFCIWISRDMDCERARNADLSMSMNRQPVDPYRTDQIISPDVGFPSDPTSPHPRQQQEEQVAEEGEYSNHYDTLRPMGKGAFGFVRMAQRKDDGTAVVVKFLRKASVLKDCWVQDDEMGEVPLEISLLAKLAHPNIVQLLEAYENEHYFQMVMEKHGDGLDLFEFIEKNPRLNEPLMSYMFRQVVEGLAYLHERSILHRDVKDENIILDHRFHLKLIDFGSAAYMAPEKLFNTFCGTLEYCSPEVLLGNSYSGPELEMWALGVTLYTLVFGENPFFEVEETISGHLQPPYLTSPALMKIIFWLLHPDPHSRAKLRDLQKDKWVNQPVDMSQYSFELVMGYATTNSSTPKRAAVKPSSMDNEHLDTTARKLQQALDEQLHANESGLYSS